MFRSGLWNLITALAFGMVVAICSFAAEPQQAEPQQSENGRDKSFDVRSSVGDLHLGKDADARAAGFALYPGARPKHEDNNDPLNFGIVTESFGFKIVIAKYESDDAPAKVLSFYRDRLKKYGKVLECHTSEHGGDAHAEANEGQHSKERKCEGDNSGPITELKVGTEENQHVVAVESNDKGSGSIFSLVYLHTRGKQGDI
jgi:hypothetical protein